MRALMIAGMVAVTLLVSAVSGWAHEGHHHHETETIAEASTEFDPALLGFSGMRELFNVHPVFVHFPIALFPSALLLYGLGILFNWRTVCSAGRACLYLAAAGAILAVITGWTAQETFPHNARIHHMMATHKSIGLGIALLSLPLVIWSFVQKMQRPRAAYVFLAGLAVTTYAVLQNADLGGRMVFIEGASVKPAVSVISDEPEESHHHESGEEDVTPAH